MVFFVDFITKPTPIMSYTKCDNSPMLQCINILLLVAHTLFFYRAANGIATQLKCHGYATVPCTTISDFKVEK
jgi:hypothetical protein